MYVQELVTGHEERHYGEKLVISWEVGIETDCIEMRCEYVSWVSCLRVGFNGRLLCT
jgi:hypothetical protein